MDEEFCQQCNHNFRDCACEAVCLPPPPKPEPSAGVTEFVIPAEWQTGGRQIVGSVVKVVLKSDYEAVRKERDEARASITVLKGLHQGYANGMEMRVAKYQEMLNQIILRGPTRSWSLVPRRLLRWIDNLGRTEEEP